MNYSACLCFFSANSWSRDRPVLSSGVMPLVPLCTSRPMSDTRTRKASADGKHGAWRKRNISARLPRKAPSLCFDVCDVGPSVLETERNTLALARVNIRSCCLWEFCLRTHRHSIIPLPPWPRGTDGSAPLLHRVCRTSFVKAGKGTVQRQSFSICYCNLALTYARLCP